jgi:hypothetical protein
MISKYNQTQCTIINMELSKPQMGHLTENQAEQLRPPIHTWGLKHNQQLLARWNASSEGLKGRDGPRLQNWEVTCSVIPLI